MANINITTEELQKVLQGTGISEEYFMARLSNIKMDEYNSKKEKPVTQEQEKEMVVA